MNKKLPSRGEIMFLLSSNVIVFNAYAQVSRPHPLAQPIKKLQQIIETERIVQLPGHRLSIRGFFWPLAVRKVKFLHMLS